jgi:hypothetical protein
VYLLNVSAEMSQSAKGSVAAIGRTLVPLSPRATLNGLFRKNEFNVCMTAISAMVYSVPNIQRGMTECYLRHFPTGLVFLLERVRAVVARELVGSTELFSATAVLTLVRLFTGMDSRVSCQMFETSKRVITDGTFERAIRFWRRVERGCCSLW